MSQSANNIEELQTEDTSFQFTNAAKTANAQSNNTENETVIDTSMSNDDDACKNAPSTVMSTECRSYEEKNIADGLGNNLEESNESTSNKSPQIEQRTINLEKERVEDQMLFVLKSPVPLDTTYDLQTVAEPSRKEGSTKSPTALPNAGQEQNSANLNVLSPIVEVINECLNPSTNTNNLSAPQNNTLQQNESSNAGTLGPLPLFQYQRIIC
ncbi:unnamed protein product [Pieris macdunnoughi]|uniref:Uncharacterized protein n=1 Tax=Pieris macdunnoughi TaxID=345717 RepID=A0A821PYB7_9NEOP|nr:unnamed protein product [Pieris macdunnoughi]